MGQPSQISLEPAVTPKDRLEARMLGRDWTWSWVSYTGHDPVTAATWSDNPGVGSHLVSSWKPNALSYMDRVKLNPQLTYLYDGLYSKNTTDIAHGFGSI